MPYFSGPNGIREVADAGDRFQQSFNTARRGKLLSDFFTNGQTDLGALARLDPEAAQQIQAQQKQQGLAKMFADLYAAPEAERPKGIAALLAQDPVMGQQAMERFDPRFQRQNAELAPRVVGNALVDSTGKVLFQAPERTEYQWSDRAGAWIPKPGMQGAQTGGGQPPSREPFNVQYDGPPEGRAAFEAAIRQDQAMGSPPGDYTINTPMQNGLSAIPVAGIGPNTPPPKFQSRQYTQQEVAAMGLPTGTVAFTTESGKPDIVSKPDAAQSGQMPMPVRAMTEDLEIQSALDANARAGSVLLKHANRLKSGDLQVSPVKSYGGKAREFFGQANQNDVNLTELRADMIAIVNESLRLNKGVQTEGDAQRAYNEIMTSNDPSVVGRALERLANFTKMAAEHQARRRRLLYRNYGRGGQSQGQQQEAPPANGGFLRFNPATGDFD